MLSTSFSRHFSTWTKNRHKSSVFLDSVARPFSSAPGFSMQWSVLYAICFGSSVPCVVCDLEKLKNSSCLINISEKIILLWNIIITVPTVASPLCIDTSLFTRKIPKCFFTSTENYILFFFLFSTAWKIVIILTYFFNLSCVQ